MTSRVFGWKVSKQENWNSQRIYYIHPWLAPLKWKNVRFLLFILIVSINFNVSTAGGPANVQTVINLIPNCMKHVQCNSSHSYLDRLGNVFDISPQEKNRVSLNPETEETINWSASDDSSPMHLAIKAIAAGAAEVHFSSIVVIAYQSKNLIRQAATRMHLSHAVSTSGTREILFDRTGVRSAQISFVTSQILVVAWPCEQPGLATSDLKRHKRNLKWCRLRPGKRTRSRVAPSTFWLSSSVVSGMRPLESASKTLYPRSRSPTCSTWKPA